MTDDDQRIAYGATCSWWDSITEVAATPSGLPCCPHCGGVLFEVEDEAQWWAGVERYEENGHPGYRGMIEWARGKCFGGPPLEAMSRAYELESRGETWPPWAAS